MPLHTLTALLALAQPPQLEKLPADVPAKVAPPAKSADKPAAKPSAFDYRSASVRTAYETDRRDAYGRVVTNTQHGSGTVVQVEANRLLVLACNHTVHEGGYRAGRLYVTAADGKRRPAKVLHHDAAADLSVIEVPGGGFAGVTAATVAAAEAYRPGTPVAKAGFPGAGAFHVSRGTIHSVTSTSTADPSVVNTIATATARGGDSGGGLFRESDNALVGVVWGGREDGLRASRLREIRAILAKAGVEGEFFRKLYPALAAKDATPVKVPDAAKPVTLTVQGGSRDVLNLTRQLKAGKTYRVTVEEVAESVPVKDAPPTK